MDEMELAVKVYKLLDELFCDQYGQSLHQVTITDGQQVRTIKYDEELAVAN